MKEVYFSEESLLGNATILQNELKHYFAGRPYVLDPEHAALLVLDMQRYFLDPASRAFIPSAPSIVPGLLELVTVFMERDLPVIFTKHLNTPGKAGSMDLWWEDLIREEDPMSELIPEIARLEPAVLEKQQYDAFYGTDLDDWLRGNDVKQVIIGGVMTHLCCETTARTAFVHGFEVFFLIDGTATHNLEFHRSSLLTLSHGFAHTVRIRQMIDGVVAALDPVIEMEEGDDYDDGD